MTSSLSSYKETEAEESVEETTELGARRLDFTEEDETDDKVKLVPGKARRKMRRPGRANIGVWSGFRAF